MIKVEISSLKAAVKHSITPQGQPKRKREERESVCERKSVCVREREREREKANIVYIVERYTRCVKNTELKPASYTIN